MRSSGGHRSSGQVLWGTQYLTLHNRHYVLNPFTAWGAPLSVTDPAGRVTNTIYNAAGQMVSIEQDGATLGSVSYDAVGRVQSSTDALGLTISYEYNNLDAVTKVSYPDGTTEETDYTCCRLPGVVKDRAGRKTYYDYDVLRRLVRVQDAGGNTLEMDYDRENRRTRLIDAKGRSTRWSYDALGRVAQKTYHDGTTEGFSYAQGLLSQSRGARGQIVKYAYDDNANVTGIDYPNMADVSFSYNALGRRASMSDSIGTTSWNYDSVGRLMGESGPFVNSGLSYSYDSSKRLQSVAVARDATSSDVTSFGYDTLGRLTTLKSGVDEAAGFSNVKTFSYSYLGTTGRLSHLDLPNGTKAQYAYEGQNSLKRLIGVANVLPDGSNASTFSYAYGDNAFRDNRSNVSKRYGSEVAQTSSYGYNVTSMLTGESAAAGGSSTPELNKSYAFDAMGNRTNWSDGVSKTSQSAQYNGLNQLTGVSSYSTSTNTATLTGSQSMGYDADGNLGAVVSRNAQGTESGRTSYAYDDASRLVKIEVPNSSKWEFAYDGMSRLRISRQSSWVNGAWVVGEEKRRVYVGMNVVQERDGTNAVTASYTRVGNIGGLLARSTSTGNVFYGYDGGGNVTTLTDQAGAVVASYTYDAWGNIVASSGAYAARNPYRFSTKENIAGLYSYGFRFYSPSTGRWINRDPMGEGGGSNLYAFAADSPPNYVDSYGENALALNPGNVAAGAGLLTGLGAFVGTITVPVWGPPAAAGAAGAAIGTTIGLPLGNAIAEHYWPVGEEVELYGPTVMPAGAAEEAQIRGILGERGIRPGDWDYEQKKGELHDRIGDDKVPVGDRTNPDLPIEDIRNAAEEMFPKRTSCPPDPRRDRRRGR